MVPAIRAKSFDSALRVLLFHRQPENGIDGGMVSVGLDSLAAAALPVRISRNDLYFASFKAWVFNVKFPECESPTVSCGRSPALARMLR